MDLPNVYHPQLFEGDGIKFQVVSYEPLTQEQAKAALERFLRTHLLSPHLAGATIEVHVNQNLDFLD
jgi:hypothetical protein